MLYALAAVSLLRWILLGSEDATARFAKVTDISIFVIRNAVNDSLNFRETALNGITACVA